MENPIKDAGEGVEKAARGITGLIESIRKGPLLVLFLLVCGQNVYQMLQKDKIADQSRADLRQFLIFGQENLNSKDRIIGLQDTVHQLQYTNEDLRKENQQLNQLLNEKRR